MMTSCVFGKPGSHMPPTYLQRSGRLQLTTFGDLSQWVPDASAMDRRRTQILREMQIELAQFLTISPVNMDHIVLLEYVASANDVHINYFHRRQPPTTAGLPAKLNSAQLCRQAGG